MLHKKDPDRCHDVKLVLAGNCTVQFHVLLRIKGSYTLIAFHSCLFILL